MDTDQDPDDDQLPLSQAAMQQTDRLRLNHVMSHMAVVQEEAVPSNGARVHRRALPRHGKTFCDPVHGHFRLDPVCICIIDSPQFQRLRDLKQLGATYLIFPGASHNRFEHSLGVAFKAFEAADKIWNMQRAEVDIDRRDCRVVEVAGLCHDLGHGPLSHVFDRELLRRKGITSWSHEDMSGRMLDLIIDEGHVPDDALSEDDVKRVKSLITDAHRPAACETPRSGAAGPLSNIEHGMGALSGKRFLYDIDDGHLRQHCPLIAASAVHAGLHMLMLRQINMGVANERNSIDVDKVDYIQRDSLYCNVKISCDFNRLQSMTKVVGDEVCFKWSEYENVFELFHARASLHRRVYTHRKAKAVELMLVDALLEADPVLRLQDRIQDPREFMRLDDTVVRQLENYELLRGDLGESEHEHAIRAAQRIIARVRQRDLYKYCAEVLIPPELVSADQWREPSAQDVISCYSGPVKLKVDDIILSQTSIDFAMKARNPLDHVSFFQDWTSTQAFRMQKALVSSMFPDTFQERRLRAYSRRSDPACVDAVHQAFDNWVARRWNSRVVTSTPLRPPRQVQPQLAESVLAVKKRRLELRTSPL